VHITGIKEGNQQIEICKNPDPEAIAAFHAKPPMKPRAPKKRKRNLEGSGSRFSAAETAVIKLRQDALQSAISSPVFGMLSETQQLELKDAWFQLAMGQVSGEAVEGSNMGDGPSAPILMPAHQQIGTANESVTI
jgi:hypothetical protein